MSRLTDALEQAQRRKEAVFGNPDPDADVIITPGHGDFADRAVFTGFDMNLDDLSEAVRGVSLLFHRMYHSGQLMGADESSNPQLSLRYLFGSAWVDGFLVGLMYKDATESEQS